MPSTSGQRSPPTPVPPSSWSCRRPFILLAPTSSSSFVTPPHHDIEHHKPPSARDHRIAPPSVRHYDVVVGFLRALQHSGQPPSCALSSSRAPHCRDPSPTRSLLLSIATSTIPYCHRHRHLKTPARISPPLLHTPQTPPPHTHTIGSGARRTYSICLSRPNTYCHICHQDHLLLAKSAFIICILQILFYLQIGLSNPITFINISFLTANQPGMMDGALAARHLMQTPKPTNFQFPPFPPFLPPLPPLPFPCILPVICPSPPSPPPSTTTVP
ncbi:hypothetical protein ACSQ67_004196 [Phaseolus vulgaris]